MAVLDVRIFQHFKRSTFLLKMNASKHAVSSLVICSAFVIYTLAEIEHEGRSHVQLTPEVALTGEPFHCENDPTKFGYTYYGIRYGIAKRFQHADESMDFAYLSDPKQPKQGFPCPQHAFAMPGFPKRNLTISEDCLYLDVYVPPVSQTRNDSKLPVLFFIYGGGFQIGHKNMYNATELSGAVNAVVVIINYRVSAYGFLSTGDGAIKGNYGIGDIKVALQWVRKHIEKFGGDPEAITIMGQSAGGALTSAMFLDKNVRESVRAGIAMSGSMFSPWSINRTPKRLADKLSLLLGCPNATQAQFVQCLTTVPLEQMQNVIQRIEKKFTPWNMFAPVIDGVHLPEPPALMISKQPPKESKREGIFVTGYLREDSSMSIMVTQFRSMKKPFLPNSTFDFPMAKEIVTFYARLIHPRNLTKTVEQILQHYKFDANDVDRATMRKTFHVVTDIMFAFSAVQEARAYSNRSFSSHVTSHLYRISYDPKFKGLGSFHGLDLVMLFSGQMKAMMDNRTLNAVVVNNFRNMFHQIVQTGRVDGPNAREGYMEFGTSGRWEAGLEDFSRLSQFWTEQIEKSQICAALPSALSLNHGQRVDPYLTPFEDER
ncbi:carboxylic ester hydrolase-like [Paramacrobiotus metropolitanus]|uniref:carboxylic ester hydrolase-like n=1 Tax=Paramacrobiotus metropolitanus TaxID=2943436 RepID=UPI0024455E9C|nr:carboxylic ester hydrolase-like [Paramacrobiotus metropolitanus]